MFVCIRTLSIVGMIYVHIVWILSDILPNLRSIRIAFEDGSLQERSSPFLLMPIAGSQNWSSVSYHKTNNGQLAAWVGQAIVPEEYVTFLTLFASAISAALKRRHPGGRWLLVPGKIQRFCICFKQSSRLEQTRSLRPVVAPVLADANEQNARDKTRTLNARLRK